MSNMVNGGPGAETFDGLADAPDEILAGGGNDLLRGNGAGSGATDRLSGEAGDDTLVSGPSGFAVMDGGPGADSLVAGASGLDSAAGGEGDDTLLGDAGADYLAGDDYDIFTAGPSTSTGDDVIDGGGGDDVISGGPGDDTLSPGTAGTGFDRVIGGDGNDVLALAGAPLEYRIDTGTGFLQSLAPIGAVGSGVRVDALDVEQVAFGVTAQQLAAGAVPLTLADWSALFEGSAASGIGRAHFSLSDRVRGVVGDNVVAISLADLLVNDVDPDGDTLSFVGITPLAGPGITGFRLVLAPADITNEGYDPALFPQGLLLATLDAPFAAPLRFTYRTQMEANGTIETGSTAVVTIALPPSVADDLFYAPIGGSLTIGYDELLANDNDVRITGISASSPAEVVLTDDPVARTVTLTHLGSAALDTAFTYDAEDDAGTIYTANVTLRIGGWPITDDELRGNFGTETFIPYATLLANDGPGAVFGGISNVFLESPGSVVDDPGRGGIVITSPGFFRNVASFDYSLAGGAGTASVRVELDNGPPVAVPLARVVAPSSTLTLTFDEIVGHFGHFDYELDFLAMGRILGATGTGASWTVTPTGVDLTFDAAYAGGFALNYTLVDTPRGAESPASTISFLTAAPPAPVAVADTLTWGIGDGRSIFEGSVPGYGIVWSRELLANDVFMPGTVRIWNVPFDLTPGSNSELVRVIERGIPGVLGVTDRTDNGFGLEFRPSVRGTDTFAYTIVDPLGRTAQGLLTFDVSIPQPFLRDDVIIVPAGATSVTVTAAQILGNDVFTGAGAIAEVQGIPLTGVVDSGVEIGGGRTRIDAFTVTFDPLRPLSEYEVRVTAFDTAADAGSASGFQRVTFAPDTPLVAAADTVRWTYGAYGAVPVERLLANDSGLGALEVVGIPFSPAFVTTALGRPISAFNQDPDPVAEFLEYIAPAGARPTSITDSFAYTVRDAAGREASSTVTIVVDNTAPVAADLVLARAPGTVLNLGFLVAGAFDADGDRVRVKEFNAFGTASYETIRDTATNEITGYRLLYDPAAGPATFQYFVEDDSGAFGAGDLGTLIVAPFEVGVAARFASVAEGTAPGAGGQLQFAFTRTGDLSLPATVTYVTGPGTVNGATTDDVGGAFPGGTITFAANQREAFLFFSATPDARGEPDETVTLTITGTSIGIIGAQSSATITIANDDGPPPVVTVVAFSETVQEGRNDGAGSSVQFNFTRTGNIAGPATVTYAVGPGATNGVTADDVGGTFLAGTIAFAAGQATTALSFPIANDTLDEPNETLTLTLTGATDAVIGTPASATVTILDDDLPPNVFTIAPQNATVTEGTAPGTGGSLVFVVTRSGDLSAVATVNFETTLAATTAAVDDVVGGFPFGALLFQAGEAQRSITIPLAPDSLDEPDETYTVTLTGSATGVIGAQASATITILDDDAPPPLPTAALDAADVGTVSEGNAPTAASNPALEFVIRRTGDLSQAGTVTFVLDAASGSTLTAADIGFVAAGGNGLGGGFGPFAADFAAGEESKIIFVFAAGDRVPEADEAVRLTLTGGTGATLSTTGVLSATGTFANDDVLPTIALQSASAGSVAEGDTTGGQLQFVITRTGDLSYATQVGFNVGGANGATEDDIVAVAADGTDIANGFGDYAVDFAAGQASRTITVTAAPDRTPEADEAVVLTLTGAALGTLSTTGVLSATGTFTNDDVLPTIALQSASAGSVAEGDTTGGQLQFVITRSGDLSYASQVGFNVGGANGATAGDIALVAESGNTLGTGFGAYSITFAAGEASRSITVAAAPDRTPEADEGVVLTLTGAALGTLSATGVLSATGTFTNDDVFPEVSLVAGSFSAPEGDAFGGIIPVVIRRTGDLSYATEVTFTVAGLDSTTAADIAVIADAGTPFGAGFGSFTVTFAAGETDRTVNIIAAGDTVPEADELFTLTLTGASLGTLSSTGPLSVTGTIVNDDVTLPRVSLVAEAVNNAEGTGAATPGALDGIFTHTLLRNGDTSAATTVRVAIAGGTATAADIAAVEGAVREGGGTDPFGTWLVSFAPGETTKELVIRSTRDTRYERDEDFTVTLLDGAGYERDTAQITAATSIIRNDESAPDIFVVATSTNGFDEGGGAPINVFFLLGAGTETDVPVVVTWEVVPVANGLSGRAASEDDLFNGFESGSSTIDPGPSSAPAIQLFVVDDGEPEGWEDFGILITGVTDGVYPRANPYVLRIRDNEPQPPRPPVAQDVPLAIIYDEDDAFPLSLRLADWASDPDNDIVAYEILSAIGFSFTFDPVTTNLVLTLLPDFNGTASLQWLVADSGDRTDTGRFTATVMPVNDAPVGVADGVVTTRNTPVTFDPVANDTDVDGDALAAGGFTLPANGTLALAGGLVTYTPRAGFSGTDSFTYRPFDGTAQGAPTTVTVTVIGPTPDDATGTDGPDTINGLGGDDTLRGLAGADRLAGGDGNDVLEGGAGNDRLFGGTGDDLLEGGDGNDSLFANDGADTLLGGAGDDRLDAGADDDRLDGGEGADRLFGGSGADLLDGGDGNDSLFGAGGADTLRGGDGDDRLDGGAEDDRLDGGAGADRLFGGAGDDLLDGSAGNDSLFGEGGGDTLRGGAGDDRVDAGAGDDLLEGGEGADRLFGGAGADTLDGGAGADELRGGAGADLFRYVLAADSPAGDGDRIRDFEGGFDRLDLSAIDADPDAPGDQAFVLLAPGAAFSGGAAELRQLVDPVLGSVALELVLAAGAGPTMRITLTGTTSPLSASDIIL